MTNRIESPGDWAEVVKRGRKKPPPGGPSLTYRDKRPVIFRKSTDPEIKLRSIVRNNFGNVNRWLFLETLMFEEELKEFNARATEEERAALNLFVSSRSEGFNYKVEEITTTKTNNSGRFLLICIPDDYTKIKIEQDYIGIGDIAKTKTGYPNTDMTIGSFLLTDQIKTAKTELIEYLERNDGQLTVMSGVIADFEKMQVIH